MGATVNELLFEHMKGQAQFAYFQLGVAASAIAFAIHETSGDALSDTPWLMGVAVALWAISFALGCFGLSARLRAISTNAGFLKVTNGFSDAIADPELKSAYEQARMLTQRDVDRPVPRFRWQMWTLFAGALAFIGGHIQQMANAPPSVHVAAPQR